MTVNTPLSELDQLVFAASRHAGTPEGDALVAAARALRASVPDARSPVLRITAAPGIPLDDLVTEFRALNPQIEVEFTVSRAGVRALRGGRADVSAVWLPQHLRGLGSAPLGSSHPVVALAPSDPLASLDRIELAALGEHHLLQNPDTVPEWRELARELRGQTIGQRKSLELGLLATVGLQLDHVAAGNGIVILPRPVAEAEQRNDVVLVPVEGLGEHTSALIWADERVPRPEVADFTRLAAGLR
ncbi:LysR family transcriptional regulator substrate-binding protein [Subtercola boreus]|nr:LysR family transcriptional regulator substrate-binding protein [Subtercola boreus]